MRDLNFNLDYIKDINSKLKMKKLIDKIRVVINNHVVETTDFLDPYEIKLSKAILEQVSEIKYIEYGGLEDSERKIIYIFPDYMNSSDIESRVFYLKAERFEGLTHRDYLGSILALGVVREKMGDILLYNDFAIFIVKKEIMDYISINLTKIGSKPIKIQEIEGELVKPPLEDFEEIQIFAASLRLDIILSSIYNISRSDSLKRIKANDVKINWEYISKPTKILSEGDTISLRACGRSKIVSFKGQSKKGKYILIVRKLK